MQYLTTAQLSVTLRSLATKVRDEAGEGVISTAIAVLILAFVGAGMWIGFSSLMTDACDAAGQQMAQNIGDGSSTIDCQ